MGALVIAYEPVWSISGSVKSKAGDSESAFRTAVLIRKILIDTAGNELARKIPILYGGSASSANAKQFLKDGQMDGLLVGNKSLDKEEFKKILISHLSPRENGSLATVAKYLNSIEKSFSLGFRKATDLSLIAESLKNMKDGDAVILENIRLQDGEEQNDENFARRLANLGDIYVNEAFSV